MKGFFWGAWVVVITWNTHTHMMSFRKEGRYKRLFFFFSGGQLVSRPETKNGNLRKGQKWKGNCSVKSLLTHCFRVRALSAYYTRSRCSRYNISVVCVFGNEGSPIEAGSHRFSLEPRERERCFFLRELVVMMRSLALLGTNRDIYSCSS